MFPYQDSSLPVEQRLDDLISRMTLEEKIMQTDQYFTNDFTKSDSMDRVLSLDLDAMDKLLRGYSVGSIQARGVTPAMTNAIQRYAIEKTRLGIPFLFSEEALHGFNHYDATVFPQQIGLASTFDPELGRKMGHAIGTEARSIGVHETYSPVMDLARDPRYGRTEETFGEDTFLSGEFARETVRGMQGEDLTAPDAIAAEPKHYVGYGNPVGGLNCAPSTMGRHDVFSDCLPIFEEAFKEAGAMDAMCSYNSIDSIPVSMDHELLTDVLRGQFGMRGFVRSDLTAIVRLNDWHFITKTRKEAIAVGMEAGVDLQLYDYPHDEWQNSLKELVEEGRLKESVLDTACRRVLRAKFLLGLFENPYVDESRFNKVMHCHEHLDIAKQIARESICLLRNKDGLLPLSKNLNTIAVLGPSANSPVLGDYTPMLQGKAVSVLDGIRAMVSPETTVLHEAGCSYLGEVAIPFESCTLTDENGNPGLTGRYYNGRTPEGTPVCVRNDASIRFNWILAKPHPDLDAGAYSVAWTGKLTMQETFDGGIGFSTQDSMRLYVDGQLLLDGWGPDKDADRLVPFHFEANHPYDIRVEFTNDQRGARIILGYSRGPENFTAAVEAARKADVAIVCLGDDTTTSGENFDRVSLDLPGAQLDFLKAVYETGTPVVLVLQTGRPVTAVWEQEHIPAILEAWFPGVQGGHAIAETLFGDNVPSGHLPISFPRHVGQIPCHYSRRPGGGRRYVEMNWLPLYPFGYGLSYTTFAYEALELSAQTIRPGESITATFRVTNTGTCTGTAVPQLYIRDYFSSVVKPEFTLCGFSRVELKPGETKTVSITIGPKTMRTLDPKYHWSVEPGDFQVVLGEHAQSQLMSKDFTVAE